MAAKVKFLSIQRLLDAKKATVNGEAITLVAFKNPSPTNKNKALVYRVDKVDINGTLKTSDVLALATDYNPLTGIVTVPADASTLVGDIFVLYGTSVK